MTTEEKMEFIKEQVGIRGLLEQLAEECAELSQASLKAIRALKLSNNPTPVEPVLALENMKEEFTDVHFMAELVGLTKNHMENEYKTDRWVKRLLEDKR